MRTFSFCTSRNTSQIRVGAWHLHRPQSSGSGFCLPVRNCQSSKPVQVERTLGTKVEEGGSGGWVRSFLVCMMSCMLYNHMQSTCIYTYQLKTPQGQGEVISLLAVTRKVKTNSIAILAKLSKKTGPIRSLNIQLLQLSEHLNSTYSRNTDFGIL